MPTIADLLREAALRWGVNPAVAVRVVGTESPRGIPGDYDLAGNPTSFGPLQFHYYTGGGGHGNVRGLGDEFTAATGLDARDQATIPQQFDFAMKKAAQGGWGPWHGAANAGIGEWEGIKQGAVSPSSGVPIGTGSIKPVSPLDPQYMTKSGVTYPGSSDPNAIGTGSIGASFAQGTAGPALSPTNIAGETGPTTPVEVVNLPNPGLGAAFASALGSLVPKQQAYSTAPLQNRAQTVGIGPGVSKPTQSILA